MLKRIIVSSSSALLLALSVQAAEAASFRMTYATTTHSVPSKGLKTDGAAAKAEPDKSDRVTITLTANRGQVESKSGKFIVDYVTRRTYLLAPADKTYTDASIFAIVAFRHFEIINRKMLSTLLAKALGKTQSMMDPVYAECELNMRMPETATGTLIQENTAGDKTTFTYQMNTLASFKQSATEVPAKYRNAFAKTLLLNSDVNLHPVVHEAIDKCGHVPQELSAHNEGAMISDQNWKLIECGESEDELKIPDDYKKITAPYDPLKEIYPLYANSKKISNAEALKAAKKYMADGHDFDAFLTIMQLILTCDEDLSDLKGLMKELPEKDAASHDYMELGESQNKEEALKICEKAIALKAKATDKAFVLDVFEAVERNKAGQPDKAKELYLNVLKHDPHMTGPYVDLGNMLMREYNTAGAWNCFDLAKENCPTIMNLEQVKELEGMLMTEHPEYFKL